MPPIGYPGNSISKEARAKAGGGYESAMAVTPPPSGDLLPGQTVSLTQGGYGSGPIIVGASNFEALADGADVTGLATDAGYKTTLTKQSSAPITADTTRKHSGTRSVKVQWTSAHTISAFGWTNMNANTDHIRMSYWRYQNLIYNPGETLLTSNIKQFYIFGTGTGEYPQALLICPAGENGWAVYNNVGEIIKNYSESVPASQGVWEHWDVYFYAGSGVNSNDGIAEVRRNGRLTHAQYDYNFQQGAGAAGSFDDVRLGHMAQRANNESEVWYDEFQVTSGGPQAIFVTDSATFDDVVDRSMASQYHTNWTDGQIDFQLNASDLPSETPLYAHVIKADRSVITHSIGQL